MKSWDIELKSKPEEIAGKLNSAFGSGDGFVFRMDPVESDPIRFDLRKRVIYPDQMLQRNRILVAGKVSRANDGHGTDLAIRFTQHIMTTLTGYMFIASGLFALILAMYGHSYGYPLGGVLVLVGVVYWIGVRAKFRKDIESYKTLLADVLEFQR